MEHKRHKLLIVEDEPALAMGLRDNFELEGYDVVTAADGMEAVQKATAENPDLILLDIMLPKLSGLDVCLQLRQQGFSSPIIMLTARSQESDIIAGLDRGADDYVTKPFRIGELVARVRAHLRRAAGVAADAGTYQLGDIYFDFRNYRAVREGNELDLSHREFELLRYFVRHRGETVTREQLLEQVWGLTHYPLTRTVDNHIAKLRQKIEPNAAEPRWIVTVHRSGYKFLG